MLDISRACDDALWPAPSHCARPAAILRRGEYAAALRFCLERGVPIYDLVSAGNFEGGDFNMIELGAVRIGYTDARSEGVAARQIGGWMELRGDDGTLETCFPRFANSNVNGNTRSNLVLVLAELRRPRKIGIGR